MTKKQRLTAILLAITALLLLARRRRKKKTKTTESDKEIASSANRVLWRSPDDIRSRNLFYGSGGEEHAPHTTYTFEKEDMDGTSPKFIVRDENGVKWKVKMGHEARSETVASRFVWAAGYSTNEDYFLPGIARRRHAQAPSPGTAICRIPGCGAQCAAKEIFGRREEDRHLEVERQPFLKHPGA